MTDAIEDGKQAPGHIIGGRRFLSAATIKHPGCERPFYDYLPIVIADTLEDDVNLATGIIDLCRQWLLLRDTQTTHATSDMIWALDRIGAERLKGAYAYQQLLQQNGWLPNGSDFPVEHINPLYGFYAAFARKNRNGHPEGGFQTENPLPNRCVPARWAPTRRIISQNPGSLSTPLTKAVTGQRSRSVRRMVSRSAWTDRRSSRASRGCWIRSQGSSVRIPLIGQ